jgi:hypothetical protein
LLFAIYPVLALLAFNIAEVKPVVALRALLLSLLAAWLLFVILAALLKNRGKAAVITSLSLLLFYSYGHAYSFLEQNDLAGLSLGRHRVLAPLWAGLFILGVLWVWRSRRDFRGLNQALNWISAAAILLPLASLVAYTVNSMTARATASTQPEAVSALKLPETGQPPDVYYIILDAYARDDVLLDDHNFDNTPFIEALEKLGFYVARCSQSNYSQTQLSLASALNMDYLPDLGEQFKPDNTSRLGVGDLIEHSRVRQAFEELGYTSIAFETGFKYTQWEDADIYYSPAAGMVERAQISGGLNDFEAILLRTSAALLLTDSASLLPKTLQADFNNPRRVHRERILYDLEQLAQIPEIPGPKLVFAHLVSPHPPYVFGPNGEFTDYDLEAKKGYIDQIHYLNSRLLPLMAEIIAKSEVEPVIILQGDHGAIHSPPSRRLAILNAYHLPQDGNNHLYPQASPVNTFRLVLNRYFSGQYPLLEDAGYFSDYKTPYDFNQVADSRQDCEP